ncbi:hypothetical protein SAMN05216418_1804 [Microbacterium enclense]|uniref:Uncharacterized protein n=1 Tax=Microbacterium enclense TaxID=993073 RepID=A0A1G6JES8_9MICO|nr:hypothetical protein SAMN05216418_1804 [Microbacterium enclense]
MCARGAVRRPGSVSPDSALDVFGRAPTAVEPHEAAASAPARRPVRRRAEVRSAHCRDLLDGRMNTVATRPGEPLLRRQGVICTGAQTLGIRLQDRIGSFQPRLASAAKVTLAAFCRGNTGENGPCQGCQGSRYYVRDQRERDREKAFSVSLFSLMDSYRSLPTLAPRTTSACFRGFSGHATLASALAEAGNLGRRPLPPPINGSRFVGPPMARITVANHVPQGNDRALRSSAPSPGGGVRARLCVGADEPGGAALRPVICVRGSPPTPPRWMWRRRLSACSAWPARA